MSKIFVGQSDLTIIVDCNGDITGTATALIKYKKPSGATGSWTAAVTDAANGIIEYDVASVSDIDEEGVWYIWGHLTNGAGEVLIGTRANMPVHAEGEIILL